MTAPIARLDHVSKRFGHQVALDDVSLAVEPGIVFALLGENGAGKTTAFRILLGLADADDGRAEVLGMDSRSKGRAIRQRVGYVPDQPALYEWMTVDEIGWFAAGFHEGPYHPRFRELAARFELPLDRKVKHLSKGMRSKVSLSLALAHDPPVLVLDEPTSGLDPLVRREFLESMVDVAATGRTVLLASHQVAEVERIADVIAILRHGKLVLVERLEELKGSTLELVVTLDDGAAPALEIGGMVIHEERRERQWKALVRRADVGKIEQLRREPSVRDVQTRTPILEEIFCGYLRSGAGQATWGGQAP